MWVLKLKNRNILQMPTQPTKNMQIILGGCIMQKLNYARKTLVPFRTWGVKNGSKVKIQFFKKYSKEEQELKTLNNLSPYTNVNCKDLHFNGIFTTYYKKRIIRHFLCTVSTKFCSILIFDYHILLYITGSIQLPFCKTIIMWKYTDEI